MKRLRLATADEINSIRHSADLDNGTIVLALDTQYGSILGVVKTCVEVNPVYFPDGCSDKMKYFFMRDVETFLSAKGISSYYVQLPTNDETYLETMKHYGAEQVSKEAELRFKITL